MSDKKDTEPSTQEQLREVKTELRRELRWRGIDSGDPTPEKESILTTSTDAPINFTEDDVDKVGENHFRLKMGRGFGLDIVLLHSESLAFWSYDGNLLDLKATKGWPCSLFTPVVGKA